MIWLSESYLGSSYADHDTDLNLNAAADNSQNCKRAGVIIYFKEHLAVHHVSPTNSHKFLVLEINIQKNKGYVISLYRSPKLTMSLISFF